jgi:hypothetical protein
VNRDRLDPEVLARPNDANSDLAPIRDEDPLWHRLTRRRPARSTSERTFV